MLFVYCILYIPSTVAFSSQVITTAVVTVLACGVLAPEVIETQTFFSLSLISIIKTLKSIHKCQCSHHQQL